MAESFLPTLEVEVLAFWKRERIFQRSLERESPRGRFVFYEGPPYANGKPGVHHMISRAYKDAVARYKTMRGYHVLRRAGWDTHGLPVEMAVERQLGVRTKREIEERVGVERFVEECRKNVFAMKDEWERFTERMGYWVDLDDAYVTMTPEYIESCWWIFKQISDRGLLYEDFKVVPFCTRCGTALSSHELAQGYREVEDRSLYVKFELADEPGTFVLAWTTTPWTLPGNVALAVDEDIEYVKVRQDGVRLILAADLLSVVSGEYEEVERFKGRELVGRRYAPLFDFLDLGKETGKDAYKIVAGDFVTTEEGTGVVHTAVMYGEDDFRLGAKLDLPKRHTVNADGTFNELVSPWRGRPVRAPETERAIVGYLRERGRLFREEPHRHNYPYCWRCESPLLYYAKRSWFFRTTAVKEEMQAANSKINWVPDYLREGRFGDWLDNVVDWAVSRERYWGVPLPIWQCGRPGCDGQTVVGSYGELRAQATAPIADDFDPHRPFIDGVTLRCPDCGGGMARVPAVADVWFDSGSMPFAQWHYPFDNRERIDAGEQYPADFISEGIDQTRGWFYTLLAVASLLGRAAPYKNVVSLGLVTDAKGRKMSKSKGNLIRPEELFPTYGSDAVRFYLYTVSQAGDFKRFDRKGLETVVKKTFLILWNVRSFYGLHAEGRGRLPARPVALLDRWLLARLSRLVADMTGQLDAYNLTTAGRQLAAFVTELSTWYVRRSRDRFRRDGPDRAVAAAVLGHTLETVARLLAPFSPMVAERLYRDAHGEARSVHLADWPMPNEAHEDGALLATMDRARKVVELGHALRKDAGLRLRQPLPQLVFCGAELPDELAAVVADELNVKEVHAASELPSGSEWRRTADDVGTRVALDTTVTDELRIEGIEREFVRRFNAKRKEAGLRPGVAIAAKVQTDDEMLRGVIEQRGDRIAEKIAAARVELVDGLDGDPVTIGTADVRLRIDWQQDGSA